MSLLTGSGARPFSSDNWGYPPHKPHKLPASPAAVFQTARLRRGSAPVSALPEHLQALGELSYTGPDGDPRFCLRRCWDDTWDRCVSSDEERHSCCGGLSQQHGSQFSSLAQFGVPNHFLGMLVGILAHEGAINPASPLTAYLPEFCQLPGFCNTTVQQALDMTGRHRNTAKITQDRGAEFLERDRRSGLAPGPGAG